MQPLLMARTRARRLLERKDVESIKEILAERSVGHFCRQVTIGRGDDANIDPDPISSSHPLEFPFLEHGSRGHGSIA